MKYNVLVIVKILMFTKQIYKGNVPGWNDPVKQYKQDAVFGVTCGIIMNHQEIHRGQHNATYTRTLPLCN